MEHETNLEKLFSVSQFRKIHEEMNYPDLFYEMGSGKVSEQINSLINYSATHMLLNKKRKKSGHFSTVYNAPDFLNHVLLFFIEATCKYTNRTAFLF